MNKTMIALATVAALAGSAAFAEVVAKDFSNTGLDVVFTSNNLSFAAQTTAGELDSLEARIRVLPHSLGFAEADVTAYAGYSVTTDEVYVGGKYNLSKDIKALKLYGAMGVQNMTSVPPTGL
jgi:opacity protein-like surface antigen